MIQMDTLQAVDVWFLDQEVLSVQFRAWGVEVERVERVELKALTLPQGLQRCMAAEATAAQQARAQVGNTHTHTHTCREIHTPLWSHSHPLTGMNSHVHTSGRQSMNGILWVSVSM